MSSELLLDPIADALTLDPLATSWLVLVVESAGAIGAMQGTVCVETTVQGCVEIGPVWSGRLIVSPTFAGAVEI